MRTTAAVAQMTRILQTAQPAFSEDEVRRIVNGNFLEKNGLISEEKELFWPPLGENREYVNATPAMVKDFWTKRLGASAYAELMKTYMDNDVKSRRFYQESIVQPTFDMKGQNARKQTLFDRAQTSVVNDILKGRNESGSISGRARSFAPDSCSQIALLGWHRRAFRLRSVLMLLMITK